MSEESAYRVRVEAWRGDRVESRHEVLCVVLGARPAVPDRARLEERAPDTFLRSAAKPLQLLPVVVAGGVERWGLEDRDLAVMAASHHGTAGHASRVAGILSRLGLGPEHLLCGVHRPYFLGDVPAESLERLHLYGPLHNNCSGNHAAMLALALQHGVPPERYLDPAGPGQAQVHALVEALGGVRPHIAVDNCGSPCYGVPLAAMARAYCFLARPGDVRGLAGSRRALAEAVAPLERIEAGLERVAIAMAQHPEWVSGASTGATRLARLRPGELVLKHGAEGVMCLAHRGEAAALALKVTDGNPRAVFPALVRLLHDFGWIDAAERDSVADLAQPELRGHAGQKVGALHVAHVEPVLS